MHDLRIVYEPIGMLKPAPRNVRTHNKKHIGQLEQSIRDFGFCIPILCDDDDHIVAGHGRLEAARRLGHDTVPVIRLKNLTPAALRAFAIAENKLAERGGWDRNLLALEIQELSLVLPDLDFTDIGFEAAEIDVLMAVDQGDPAHVPVAAVQRAEPAVTRLYDIWTIGDHRIVCGDATLETFYTLLTRGEAAQMAFADPPYNVRVNGHI
jgi:ParB-like chromosome segregation protein Spo0J